MGTTTETLLLQVDIQANNTRLAELQKQLNESKKANDELNKSFKAGKITADELATEQVKLKNQTAAITQEQRILTKANADQTKIFEANEGSIEQLRAQLAQGTAAYNAMSAAQRDSSEEGQKLQANNKMLSDNLKVLEAAIGDTRRNVGNYGAAIEPLIQQLVKLEEAQKLAAPDSEEYARAIPVIKGFQQQINETAIKAGVSQDALNAKFTETADAIRPATAALVKLEDEQKNVQKGTEAYTQIGFKIGQASKAIEHATAELKKGVPETKKFSAGLFETAKNSDLFGGAIGKATDIQDKFIKAQELAKLATGGWTGALGVLRVALIATGLGALAVILGSVVTYLSQTVEGSQLLTTIMDQVGAVVNVVVDRFGQFGKAVVQILSGDFKGAAATAKGAMAGFGDEIAREVKISGDLSKARQQLDIDTAKNIATNKRLLNEVERLKNIRDNEFNTIQQRQKANEDAYKIELQRESTLSELAQRRIDVLKGEIELRGGLTKASLAQRRELGEAENELADIQEDAAGKQNELITNRFTLNKELLEQQQKLREDAIKGSLAEIQARLLAVRAGSDEELALRQQLIRKQAALENAAADKTAADRKLVLAKALADELKLDEDFEKARQDRAAKFLADQDKANATALSYKQGRLAIEAKDQEDAFSRNEKLLQRNLDRRAAMLEQDYADGKVSRENYEQGIQLLEEMSLGAQIVLRKQFNKETAQLETQLAKTQGAARRKTKEEDEKLNQARLASAQEFGAAIGQLFAETLTSTGQSLQEFAGKVLILILDSLEKTVLAASAEAAAKSIALNPTPAGFIQAAVTTAAITVAFEAAKAAIAATTAEPFNTGGIVGGDTSVNRDSILTYLTPGEVVLSQGVAQKYPELLPVLSQLNTMVGGASFAPGARGGTPDGGLAGRNAVAGFDYNRFAEASAKHPIDVNYVAVTERAAARKASISKITLGGKGKAVTG
jgi:hypothetical protein